MRLVPKTAFAPVGIGLTLLMTLASATASAGGGGGGGGVQAVTVSAPSVGMLLAIQGAVLAWWMWRQR